MAKKYRWLRLTAILLMVVLFFLIVNSFRRENLSLLAERNTWQEKTVSLEEKVLQLQDEKQELKQFLNQGQPGLIVTNIDIEQLAFNKTIPSRLTYQLTLTIANQSPQSISEGSGELMLAFRLPGNPTFGRTTWRRAPHPSFRAGEVKIIPLAGEIQATPGEEMLLIFSINQQPGVAKRQVLLTGPESEDDQVLQP